MIAFDRLTLTVTLKYDLFKLYSFDTLVNIWNSLPSYVVLPNTLSYFNSRLDTSWSDEDIVYDFVQKFK